MDKKILIDIDDLVTIADVVREREGTTDKIEVVDLADRVKSLPSGGSGEYNALMDVNSFPTGSPPEVEYDENASIGISMIIKVSELDLSNWTSASRLFANMRGLKELPDTLNTSNITRMAFAFFNCSSITSIPHIDTSNNETFDSFYSGCSSLISAPYINTSKGTNFAYMYSSCSKLTTIPEMDTSNGTNFNSMFLSCSKLTSIPLLNTSNGTSFQSMFDNCSSLTSIPLLDTSKGTSLSYMFYSCKSLTTIPQLDTSNGTNFSYMFSACTALQTIPQLDTSRGTNLSRMFSNCIALTSVPQLDASKATNINQMFMSNSKLTDFGGLKNLGQAYTTSQSTNYSNYKLDLSTSTGLTHNSLMNVINNLYDIKTKGCKSQALVLGDNLQKLTSAERAIATNKGWTLS